MTLSNTTYRVGIIGGGRQGTHHARGYAIHSRTEVVAVADTDQENLDLFRERFGVPGYSDYGEMLAKERIEISAPVLPVRANAGAVVASAQAGVKAISCEKPLTASLEDADRTVEECRTKGIFFAAGLVARNYPEYWKARELIEAGGIGEVQSINVYDTNGQGGCHGINLALHFAGDPEADWVTGWVEGDPFSDYEEGHEEGTEGFGGIGGYVRFDNGIEVFGHVKEAVKKATGGRFEVVGAGGVLYDDSLGLHLLKEVRTDGTQKLGDLEEGEGIFPSWSLGGKVTYDEEGWRVPTPGMRATVDAIVESLDTGTPLKLSTGEDLRKALEICVALRESARVGHAPVKLPLEDRGLKMYPVNARWNYKKEVYGRERYMQDMATYTKS